VVSDAARSFSWRCQLLQRLDAHARLPGGGRRIANCARAGASDYEQLRDAVMTFAGRVRGKLRRGQSSCSRAESDRVSSAFLGILAAGCTCFRVGGDSDVECAAG